jgi:hypothetical protein
MGENNTTEFIQRRIRHWRTTLSGIAVILCPIIATVWPEYAVKALSVAALLSGMGHIAGADSKNVQPPKLP